MVSARSTPVRRRWSSLLAVLAAVAAGCSGGGGSDQSVAPAPGDALELSPDWHSYVQAPAEAEVLPVAITESSGDVTGEPVLAGGGGDGVTLSMAPGGASPQVVLDYGRVVGGIPSIEVAATSGSPLLRAAYSESAQWIGPDGDLAYPLTPTAALARAEDLAVSEPGTVTGGQVQGSQRYQTLTLLRPGSVTISRVWIDFSPPLVRADDYEGWFFSSSEDLNRIWFDGAYTTQMNQLAPGTPGREPKHTSDKPLLLDGAKRDRAVWSGDLVVQGPTLLYSTWDLPYLRSSLELLASYQNSRGAAAGVVSPLAPLADYPAEGIFPVTGEPYSATYSMYVILGLEIYHRFTGDVDAIEAQWPMIERQLEYNRSLVDDRALLVTADRSDALDWDYYDGPKVGAVTAYNVLYSATLRSSARLAEALGRDRGRQLMTEADTLDAAINEYLWDDERGAYPVADTIPGLAQDANALAIVHGVASPDKHSRILSALRDQLWTTPFGPLAFTSDTGFEEYVSPFASGMEVRARFAAGDTLGAIELIEDLWGHMSAPGPNATGTHWEVLSADGTPALGGYTSLAHGWATTATGALSAYVLGIRPISAGFSDWTMAPHPGDLDWAEGRVPTPDGPIDARWVREAATLTATVVAPEGTRGTIALPATEGSVVTLDGVEVDDATTTTANGDTIAAVSVFGGRQHTVVVTAQAP